ncbi:MAG: PA domain-containing protein [Fluviicola sp.]
MKKLILSLGVVLGTSSLFGQVIVSVETPLSIANFPEFTSNGDGSSWGLATLVGLTPILDTVVIADDNAVGLNAQGLPNSLHACDSANLNDMTGKIALIYRNTCGFGYKALAAQQRGAVAVIIVNREEAMVNMNGGTEGAACTIPVVFVNKSTGDQIRTTIEGGTPVTVLIGDKTGFYPNDLSIFDNGVLRPNFGTLPTRLADNAGSQAITFGGRVYNNGSASMSNVTINVTVTRNGTEIYNQTTTPVASVASGDSVSTITLPNLAAVDYAPIGQYVITYTAEGTEEDNYPGDNVATAKFSVTTNTWSLGRSNAGDSIAADSYIRPGTLPAGIVRTCQVISDPNASEFTLTAIRMGGVTKAVADSTAFSYDTPVLVWRIFEWAGTSGNYTFTGNTTIAAASYTEVASGEITLDAAYPGEEQFDMPINGTPFTLANNQKYLVCFETPEPRLFVAYSNEDLYDFNANTDDLIRHPLLSGTTWSLGGFQNTGAPAFALVDGSLGVTETETIAGSAYPNPAQDIVRFNVAKSGDAVLNVTDMSGRTVATRAINVENGQFIISVADLNNGAYIFNVTFDDNSVSRINVAVAK